MEEDNNYRASFRISSDKLSASEITKILGISPSNSFEKGKLISQRNPDSKRRESSLWILESGLADSEDMEKHLNKLLSIIESKLTELQSLKDICEMDIFCSFFLSSEMIKKLSLIPLDLLYDIYR